MLQAATLLLGRLAKGALTAKPQDVPLMREKLAWLLEQLRRSRSNSHAYRETRALFNHFPRRELLYADVAVAQDARRSHGLHVERQRDRGDDAAPARATTTVLDRVLRPALLAQGVEEDLKAALGEAFGPISFNTWADMGVIALLVFYFDQSDARASDRRRRRSHDIVERVISTWEDRVAVTLEQTFGPAEGRRLFTPLHPQRDRAAACIASRRGPRKCRRISRRLRDDRGAARDARPRRHRRYRRR